VVELLEVLKWRTLDARVCCSAAWLKMLQRAIGKAGLRKGWEMGHLVAVARRERKGMDGKTICRRSGGSFIE